MVEWGNASFSDASVSKFFDGIAFHWYSGDEFSKIDKLHRSFPDKMLLPSEATYERYRFKPGTTLEKGDWRFGEGYARDIIGDLNAGSVGWLDWNLLLDERGGGRWTSAALGGGLAHLLGVPPRSAGPNHLDNTCDAAIMANISAQEVYFHPQYYFMGHFSKYIVPGSRILQARVQSAPPHAGDGEEEEDAPRLYGTCTSRDGFQAVAAARPDGRDVVVVLNCGHHGLDYKIKDGDHVYRLHVPPHAIQSVILP